MLGSLHDAEDALQDAMLRAWRGLARYGERASLRTWLYKIATNACLDTIARRPKRVLPIEYDDEPLVESVWMEPYPDDNLDDVEPAPDARYEQREAVELAFVAALQHLPANQRAALILREVLGFSAKEVAEALDTTVVSVNSALQRARATVEERLPERTQQATLRALGDDELRAIVDAYVEAWERNDVDAVVALLAQDATFSMPPIAAWYRGREAIRAFLPTGPMSAPRRFVPLRASGQPAFGTYLWIPEREELVVNAVHVIGLRGSEIADATAFLSREVTEAFGLPEVLR